MPLTEQPLPANLKQVFEALNFNPAEASFLAAGCVTEPQGYRVPTCRINVMPSGVVPAAAASRLGVPSSGPKFKVTLQRGQIASPGVNKAVFLTGGIYETNSTFDAEGYAADQETRNPANYLSRWEDSNQTRVYFVMPEDVVPLNRSAEREHCQDFIHAYRLTLQAVDSVFQTLNGVTMDGYLNQLEAKDAMVKRVGEQLAPALRPIACDPVRLEAKFKELLVQSRDRRDGRGWHSFGVEVLDQPPQGHGEITYLTGMQRQESGRIYLNFTKGQTQINLHSSEKVITL